MNFWEWVKYIDWKIESKLGLTPSARQSAESHAQSLWDVTHATGGMDKQINDTVNAFKIKHTGILGVLDTFGKNLVNVIKNLPYIVLAVALLILFVYLMPYLKKDK